MLSIRPYQLEAIEAVKEARSSGINRQLISLPTGTGKTVTFAALAQDLNSKTIILAHREELIHQAADKFRLVWPEADIGVVMADSNDMDKQIVIASVQTVSRPKRLEALKELGFKLMIVDEAHHAASESYRNVINGLGFTKNNTDKLLVGVTATPTRGDGHSLGDIFESIIFERSISTMIKAGYLSDLKGKRILTHTDLRDWAKITATLSMKRAA
jgi:superfamily II DNA or RNA helicase